MNISENINLTSRFYIILRVRVIKKPSLYRKAFKMYCTIRLPLEGKLSTQVTDEV